MKPNKAFPDPADVHGWLDEADIGSGEKTAAEMETDDIIRDIPSPLPEPGQDSSVLVGERDFDPSEVRHHIELEDSLERDEPEPPLDELDPVPPKGQ